MALPRSARICTTMCASAAIALLAGCGGATKTVSIASAPTTSTGTTGASSGPRTPASTTSTATTPSATTNAGGAAGGTPAGTSTRTATAPAFTEKGEGAGTEGLAGAAAIVRAHGYTPGETSDYHPSQTLRVLVGTGSHSNDGYDKQAFFFVDGHYLGTDASRPSAQISVVSQNDTEVTLAYQLYRPNDPLCCPGGGTAHVRFQLNNGRLVSLDPIPPVSSSTGTSRQ